MENVFEKLILEYYTTSATTIKIRRNVSQTATWKSQEPLNCQAG